MLILGDPSLFLPVASFPYSVPVSDGWVTLHRINVARVAEALICWCGFAVCLLWLSQLALKCTLRCPWFLHDGFLGIWRPGAGISGPWLSLFF